MLGTWLATRLAMVGPFGIPDEDRLLLVIERIAPAEQGIDDTLADLYRRYARPLDYASLFQWQRWLMKGRTDLRIVTLASYERRR